MHAAALKGVFAGIHISQPSSRAFSSSEWGFQRANFPPLSGDEQRVRVFNWFLARLSLDKKYRFLRWRERPFATGVSRWLSEFQSVPPFLGHGIAGVPWAWHASGRGPPVGRVSASARFSVGARWRAFFFFVGGDSAYCAPTFRTRPPVNGTSPPRRRSRRQ